RARPDLPADYQRTSYSPPKALRRSMRLARPQPALQPGEGEGPMPLHRRRRDLERFRGLFHAQPSEGPQLDDARLLLVEGGQLDEGLVEGEQIEPARRHRRERIVQGDAC